MYNVTVDSLKATYGAQAAEKFNEIAKLTGAGVTATGFGAVEGGIAVTKDTPNFAEVEKIIKVGAVAVNSNKKEGN